MNYRAYFSPTNGTENAVTILADCISKEWQDIDLTKVSTRKNEFKMNSDDLLVIGMPVYSGRLPQIDGLFDCLKGDNTPCVICACYGNRDYDDTLLELQDELKSRGFVSIAGCSMVIPHVYNQKIGANRPDDQDKKEIKEFADKIISKLGKDNSEVVVKGNNPYKALKENNQTPIKNEETCVGCGKCAMTCPTNAIDDKTFLGNGELCVRCMKCVVVCPTNSRSLDVSRLTNWLAENCSERSQNEYFI